MKLTIKFLAYLAIWITSFVCPHLINSQSFSETLKFADQKFNEGDLDLALKTYERLAFFAQDSTSLPIAIKIADISFTKMDFETAQTNYGYAINLSNDSLQILDFYFKKVFCQIKAQKYQNALIDLFSISDTNAHINNRLNFYIGTCYFGLNDFVKSEEYFLKLTTIENNPMITKLLHDKKLKSPSPKLAYILSTIIPGAGQIYSGDYKQGAISFCLTMGLLYLGSYNAIHYNVLDAIITILPWYQRYYTGGYNHAEDIAKKKLASNRSKIYNKILSNLESSIH